MDTDYTGKMSLRDRVTLEMEQRGYVPLKVLAAKWGLTTDCVKAKRQRHEVEGAVFSAVAHIWFAPIDTPKPILRIRQPVKAIDIAPRSDLRVPYENLHWGPPESNRRMLPWPVVFALG